MEYLRISGIEPESIVDGPGFRYVIFTQGCLHHCKGCHNPETWDFEGGELISVDDVFADIMSNPYVRGVTFSGGEPFEQVPALLELARRIKKENLSLMSYTGYTYEELQARDDDDTNKLLSLLDILVDGRYEEPLRNLSLYYRGSENQRVIDMPKTIETGEVVIIEYDE